MNKYEYVKNIIRARIDQGSYPAGSLVPSQNVMMKEFNVSYSTIIRSLQDLVNEGYLFRIQGKGTFVTEHREARHSGLLGVSLSSVYVKPDFTGTWGIAAIERRAREMGYKIVVTCYENSHQTEMDNLMSMKDMVDGYLIWFSCAEENIDCLEDLRFLGKPVVLFDRYMPTYSTDYVVSDNYQGAYAATKWLIDMDMDKLVYMHPNEIVSSNTDRTAGVSQALSDAGMAQRDCQVSAIDIHHSIRRQARSLARRILKSDAGRVGFFASTSLIMLGISDALKESGKALDGSVACAWFDEAKVQIPDTTPQLQVIQPMDKIGETAVEIAVSRINREIGSPRQVELPVEFRCNRICDLTSEIKLFDRDEKILVESH